MRKMKNIIMLLYTFLVILYYNFIKRVKVFLIFTIVISIYYNYVISYKRT